MKWQSITEEPIHNVKLFVFIEYPQGGSDYRIAKLVDRFTLESYSDMWGYECDYDDLTDTYYCPAGWYEKGAQDDECAWWLMDAMDYQHITSWLKPEKP